MKRTVSCAPCFLCRCATATRQTAGDLFYGTRTHCMQARFRIWHPVCRFFCMPKHRENRWIARRSRRISTTVAPSACSPPPPRWDVHLMEQRSASKQSSRKFVGCTSCIEEVPIDSLLALSTLPRRTLRSGPWRRCPGNARACFEQYFRCKYSASTVPVPPSQLARVSCTESCAAVRMDSVCYSTKPFLG